MVALAPAEPDQHIVYLWPCNATIWHHWQQVQTQWRTGGMGGASGLDYAGVRAYLDEQGLQGEERKDTFDGIRAAERGTLEGWAAAAKQTKDQK